MVIEIFDSFGRRPEDYDERFNHFLSPEYERIIHNHKVVQDYESDLCGAYCIYYLFHRCRGYKMGAIIAHFPTNTKLNDVIVSDFMDKMVIKEM